MAGSARALIKAGSWKEITKLGEVGYGMIRSVRGGR